MTEGRKGISETTLLQLQKCNLPPDLSWSVIPLLASAPPGHCQLV